jgi:hypothetical protein
LTIRSEISSPEPWTSSRASCLTVGVGCLVSALDQVDRQARPGLVHVAVVLLAVHPESLKTRQNILSSGQICWILARISKKSPKRSKSARIFVFLTKFSKKWPEIEMFGKKSRNPARFFDLWAEKQKFDKKKQKVGKKSQILARKSKNLVSF